MANYTLDQLREDGPPYAMAMLLKCLKAGEPFVTYGAIRTELEYQFGVETIFPTQIGHVAGSLMEQILEIDPGAPLINVLITRPNGLPGKGAGGYLANRYDVELYRDWDNVAVSKKKQLVDRERRKIHRYKNWGKLNKKLFGNDAQSKLRQPKGSEADGHAPDGRNHGGSAESPEHKRLKEWVAANPRRIGLPRSFGKGETEARLLSGDSVDVLFMDGDDFVTVEVKSLRSNDDDFQRGVYQCVKYREVKKAEQVPVEANVRSLLVTERELPPELKQRARMLNVKFKRVSVNARPSR